MDDLEEHIAEVEAARLFGEELGLDFGDAFTRVDLERPPAFYWLYASHKDKIAVPEIRGLPPGRPFLFYNYNSSAKRRQKTLEEQGYDTFIHDGAGGGTPDCPIMKSLLEAEPLRRAYVVLHEGFHINRYLSDVKDFKKSTPRKWCIPYRLDEAIATVTAKFAVLQFAETHRPDLIEECYEKTQWWLDFADFVNKFYDELTLCYEEGGDREEIFERAQAEAESGKISSFEPNNAFFLRNIDYTRDTPLVHETFEGVSLEDYFADPTYIHRHLCEQIGAKFYG